MRQKWTKEEKNRYWEGCLNFSKEYPSLKLSWTIEKPR